MLKYVSKFVLDIMPSVIATVIGAYIVTTYINPKPSADASKAVAASPDKSAQPEQAASGKAVAGKSETGKSETGKSETDKSATASTETEKALTERAARPASAAAASSGASDPAAMSGESAGVKPKSSLAAGAPEPRQSASVKDKPAAKTNPAPPSGAEATSSIGERRDANELARAAIDRLRRPADAAKTDAAKPVENASAGLVNEAASQKQPVIAETVDLPNTQPLLASPLPPAVTIAAPKYTHPAAPAEPSPDSAARLVPPADIPAGRPFDVRADRGMTGNTSVADDVLSATRSFFRALTPNQN